MSIIATTPGNLIQSALFASGVIGQGQTPSGYDTTQAFIRLNQMIAQWNRKRYLIYGLQDTAFTSTGALSYTVGLGGDFNIPRPDRLEDGCFLRQTNTGQPVDYPLTLIDSYEDYNRITVKTIGTFPSYIFYDSAYPLGNVYAWPIPSDVNYDIHILTKVNIQPFATLADAVMLPDEYQAAIDWNLQVRLRSVYRLPPDPVIVALAKDALNVLRESNAQIQQLKMPREVIGRRYYYNVYSDI